MLTDKHIEKYREIYKQVFGKEVSKEKALEDGTKLVLLVKLVLSTTSKQTSKGEFPEILGQQKND